MSKPVVRIVFSALIVLALVAGIYFSVQAATSNASLSGERVFTTAGLLPDIRHVRSAGQSLSSYNYDESAYTDKGEGHGTACDNYDSPDD